MEMIQIYLFNHIIFITIAIAIAIAITITATIIPIGIDKIYNRRLKY